MRPALFILPIYCLLLLPTGVVGDTLSLKDGTVLEGRIVNENISLVVLETERGRRAVSRASIAGIERGDREKRKAISREDFKVPSRFIKAGKLEYLPDKNYLGAARDAMDSAGKSINLVMSFLKPGSMETDELIDSLIIAVQRGVDVKVLLGASRDEDIRHFHEEVRRLLSDNGVDVRFGREEGTTQARLLVIDDTLSIVGSHNWTASGLTYNSESSVLVESGAFGRLCGDYARGLFDGGTPSMR